MKQIALVVIFFSIFFSYLFYVHNRKKKALPPAQDETEEERKERIRKEKIASGECCGQHAVCERDSLLNTKMKAVYYDDEELDAFANREPSDYTDEEISQFQNVLYTMKDYDVAGWLKSLQSRDIQLPDVVREEALMIVSERRASANSDVKIQNE